MDVKDFKEIVYQKEDSGIVTVTLNTPKRKNAMSKYTTFELFWVMDALDKDETAGVMIITGAKDPDSANPRAEAFCSGGYFSPDEMAGVSEDIRSQIVCLQVNCAAQECSLESSLRSRQWYPDLNVCLSPINLLLFQVL